MRNKGIIVPFVDTVLFLNILVQIFDTDLKLDPMIRKLLQHYFVNLSVMMTKCVNNWYLQDGNFIGSLMLTPI